MRGLAAFTKKEFLELFRTGRFVVCAVCFACFGIMNPAMAKLTPWMMEMMADQLADRTDCPERWWWKRLKCRC